MHAINKITLVGFEKYQNWQNQDRRLARNLFKIVLALLTSKHLGSEIHSEIGNSNKIFVSLRS